MPVHTCFYSTVPLDMNFGLIQVVETISVAFSSQESGSQWDGYQGSESCDHSLTRQEFKKARTLRGVAAVHIVAFPLPLVALDAASCLIV